MSKIPGYQIKLDFNDYDKELIVDSFAGGGGASTGIELALGISPDIAINHDPEAIALHQANHPKTLHFINDVFEIDPATVAIGRKIGLYWLSPDCKHFSKAKGGKPKDQKIRGLEGVGTRWARQKRPRVIILENVEEFKTWGPLNKNGLPIKSKKSFSFRHFVRSFQKLGYRVEYRELKADDYGTPTTRKRFFLIARCDDEPIVWPEPTHGPIDSEDVKSKKLLPYRTAADIIDWSIPSYSIFIDKEEARQYKVKRPLANNTMERIAKGLKKFVIDNPNPYIEKDALPFITTYYGKTKNSKARGQSINNPIATITSGGLRHGLITPVVIGIDNKSSNGSWNIKKPLTTITSKARHCLVTPFITKFYKTGEGQIIKEPMHTIMPVNKNGVISAFLTKYYGNGNGSSLSEPLHTLTTKDRMGLITVNQQQYQVQDIYLRMLSPKELYAAQGFPKGYKINITLSNGKRLSKCSQVRMCGNSVCPTLAAAIVKANYKVKVAERVKVA